MGYLTANETPGTHAPSWYAQTAGTLPEHAPLEGPQNTDVCIVGGGFAGLSAALHLAERGYDVTLVEANRIGWGASGRNGGQLGYGPRADMLDYEATAGLDDAKKVWEISTEANRLVRRLIAMHRIECELANGVIEAAWKPAHARDGWAYVDHLARAYGHQRARPLYAGEIGEMLATTRYHGGILESEAGHLHPLKLALGLARAAERSGARLHEGTRAVSVAPGLVETEALDGTRGTVRATHVLLAMNGYLDGLVPAVQRRSMPINNYVVTTEPLGAERARALIPGNQAVADTKFVLDYYRLTPDHRLLWGGGESYSARFSNDIAGMLKRKILAVFPQLEDVAISHAWGGTLAITITRYPAFQRLEGGILSISGWSGSGIHMATMGGAIAAEAICGISERWDVLARQKVPAFPGGTWFRLPLLAAAMTWYGLRDRL